MITTALLILLGLISIVSATSLTSSSIQLEVTSTPTATFISSLALNQTLGAGGCSGFTPNLLNQADEATQTKLSGTGIAIIGPEGTSTWLRSTGGSVVASTSDLLVIKGVNLGSVATEDWFISLNDNVIFWNISRTFSEDVNLIGDRFGSFVFMASFLPTGSPPWSPCGGPSGAVVCAQSQMVSFLDPTFVLNNTGDAGFSFPFPTGTFGPATAAFYEGQSASQHQTLRLSPSQLAFDFTITSGLFAYGKEGINLVGALVNLGAETVNRTSNTPLKLSAGTQQTQSIRLQLQADVGVAPLQLEAMDRAMAEPMERFLRSHNVFVGNVFGNSATSVTCIHEVALYPLIQSVLASPASSSSTPWAALQAQLLYISQHAFLNSSGYLYGRWDFQGVEQAGPFDATSAFGCILDQIPQFILGVYYNAINTGDKAFVQSILPQLKRAASYLQNELQMGSGGVLITSCTQGFSRAVDPNARPSNWFDTLPFGHADALVGVYAVEAIRSLAEMCQWLGDSACATQYTNLHTSVLTAYNTTFWNGQFYSDWIDANGQRRDYLFTWNNLLAIIFGIANEQQAQSILSVIDSQRQQLIDQFAVPAKQLFCTPANMFAADQNDLLYCNAFEDSKFNATVYPYYENGDCFFLMTGLEFLARSLVLNASEVYDSMMTAMRSYNDTYFWGQRFSWFSGSMQGNDILTDHLILVWGFLRGAYGVKTTLTNGMQITNSPAVQLEGSTHTFVYLGKNVSVQIQNGKQKVITTSSS